MSDNTTLNVAECSPWPPVLQFTPEVQSGIEAATALAFGPLWDTPMNELTPAQFVSELARYETMFA